MSALSDSLAFSVIAVSLPPVVNSGYEEHPRHLGCLARPKRLTWNTTRAAVETRSVFAVHPLRNRIIYPQVNTGLLCLLPVGLIRGECFSLSVAVQMQTRVGFSTSLTFYRCTYTIYLFIYIYNVKYKPTALQIYRLCVTIN